MKDFEIQKPLKMNALFEKYRLEAPLPFSADDILSNAYHRELNSGYKERHHKAIDALPISKKLKSSLKGIVTREENRMKKWMANFMLEYPNWKPEDSMMNNASPNAIYHHHEDGWMFADIPTSQT